jgi:hypothetical protein
VSLATASKDFRVKNGLQVTNGGTFGAPVTVATPTENLHAATKEYVDQNSGGIVQFNEEVTSYTLVLTDKSKMVEMNSESANNVTIPTNTSVEFPIGSQVNILQTNTGQTSIVGDTGVTVVGTPGLKLRAQWSAATLVKRGTDSWVAIGDLSE